MDYTKFFKGKIDELKQEGRYRYFRKLSYNASHFPYAEYHHTSGKVLEVAVWCSNDYLGMGHNPIVQEAMINCISKVGAGAGGTRNISGTCLEHVKLEEELADLHHKDGALLFNSGYIANEATLSTLGAVLENCIIISDELNHASMIQGIRHSKANKKIFKHNNLKNLSEILQEIPINTPKIVAVESIYSMDGDIAPLEDILDLCEQHNALSYVDEVHAVGLYGSRGGGVLEQEGLLSHCDIIQGTLGKAFGMIGGYIASNSVIIDTIRSYASGFIFTTSLPPSIAAGAQASVSYLKRNKNLRDDHQKIVAYVKNGLKKAGIEFIDNSHIIPVMVKDAVLCQKVSDILINNHGIYLQAINYPTVPRGLERLRVVPTPRHSPQMADQLIDALQHTWKEVGLIK